MYALRIGSCVLVFLIGLRLFGRTGALFAVFAMLAFSFLLGHGESFRADPLISFLFLGCAALLTWMIGNRWAVAAAAILFASGLAISVKMQIYLPAVVALLAAAATQGGSRQLVIRRAVLFGAVLAAAYGILYGLHALSIAPVTHSLAARTLAVGSDMWLNPRLDALWRTLQWDWAFWALYVLGIAAAIRVAARSAGDERMRALSVLGLQLPLVTLFIYRNTFEYFYVSLIPLAALACGYAVARLEQGLTARPMWAAVLVVVAAVPLGSRALEYLTIHSEDTTIAQRQVVAAVHEIFPEPVPYLDRGGMIASFPRVNVPMTLYLLERVYRRGEPTMADLVRNRQPEFLLANVGGLDLGQSWDQSRSAERHLLQEDFEFLREHFIHHWGPIWVPGRAVEFMHSGDTVTFEMPVPGLYTVEAAGAVEIDGVRVDSGGVVYLGTGPHTISAIGDTSSATLRRGERLNLPAAQPPERVLYRER
jgi:hypothetical protein